MTQKANNKDLDLSKIDWLNSRSLNTAPPALAPHPGYLGTVDSLKIRLR
jgi:hypothetical protein